MDFDGLKAFLDGLDDDVAYELSVSLTGGGVVTLSRPSAEFGCLVDRDEEGFSVFPLNTVERLDVEWK